MSTQSTGSANGQAVQYRHISSEKLDEVKLSWTTVSDEQQQDAPSTDHEIAALDIIGLLPATASSTREFQLLHVVPDASKDAEPKQSPIKLATLTATGLPEDFIHRFSIPRPSHFPGSNPSRPRPQNSPTAHVIVSTGSGTGLALPVWTSLVKPLLDTLDLHQDQDYALHVTQSPTTISSLVSTTILPAALTSTPQTIVLLSGDGGIHDILNALPPSPLPQPYAPPTLILLPLGTGNALAHSSNLTRDNTLGLRTWLSGEPRPLPSFLASFSPGARILSNEGRDELPLPLVSPTVSGTGPVRGDGRGDGEQTPALRGAVVASWGLHAALVADSDTGEFRAFGAERFKMAAREALFPADGRGPHVYRGKVEILRGGSGDGEEGGWEEIGDGEHAYVLVTLLSQLEKGFTISPASEPGDGVLRLVRFGPVGGEEAMGVMGGAYRGGRHVEDERIIYERIEGLRVRFEEGEGRWRRVCVDGAIVRVEKGGWVEVRPGRRGAVDLMMPRER